MSSKWVYLILSACLSLAVSKFLRLIPADRGVNVGTERGRPNLVTIDWTYASSDEKMSSLVAIICTPRMNLGLPKSLIWSSGGRLHLNWFSRSTVFALMSRSCTYTNRGLPSLKNKHLTFRPFHVIFSSKTPYKNPYQLWIVPRPCPFQENTPKNAEKTVVSNWSTHFIIIDTFNMSTTFAERSAVVSIDFLKFISLGLVNRISFFMELEYWVAKSHSGWDCRILLA